MTIYLSSNFSAEPGAPPAYALPTGPNSFIFAYVSAEKRPHRRSAPPTGNAASADEFLFCLYYLLNLDININQQIYFYSKFKVKYVAGATPGFPFGRGRRCPTGALFAENVCN